MQNRITMNSKSLQEKFPEVYREFFSKCPIVVSVPGCFFWSGEYSVLFGGLAIKQNIPIRVYVGLEPNRRDNFEMGESITFAPSSSCFESWNRFTPDVKNKLVGFLNGEARKLWPSTRTGFKINTLSEIPPGCGLSLEGGFPTALTAAIFLASDLISPAVVNRWNQLPVYQLSADKDFDRLLRAAWKVDFVFRSAFASGAPIFFPLAHSIYPIVYFIEAQTEAAVPNLSAIDHRKYLGFRVDELINLGKKDSIDLGALRTWPVDFGLIFAEDVRDEDSTIRSIKETGEYLSTFSSWWKNILPKLGMPESKILFAKIIRDSRAKVGGAYLDALVTIGLETLYGLGRILSRGASREAIRDFLRIVNCTHQLLAPLYAPSRVSDEIGFLVDRYVRDLGDDCGAGCRLVVEKKADVLFVVNSHILRDRISELITDLQNKTKRNVDYYLWWHWMPCIWSR